MSADMALLQQAGAQAPKPSKNEPMAARTQFTGLFTNRNTLTEPGTRADHRFYGGHQDVLIDGLNMEVTNACTLKRRPGFTNYTTGTLTQPAIDFYSWQQLSGTVTTLVDTASKVYTVTPTAVTALFTKSVSTQTYFQSVGSSLYFTNGTDIKRFDGTNTYNWGIVGANISEPMTGPTITPFAGSNFTYTTTGWSYVYCYATEVPGTVGGYYHVSTASYPSANTGATANTAFPSGMNVTVGGYRSSDPQVQYVLIFRTTDGGSSYLYLGSVANAGSGQWSFTDSYKDTSLNPFISAPINSINNAPPAGLINLTYWSGRVWGSVGNMVYYASGPDTTIGDGNASFPPLNYFQVTSQVTRLVPYPNGLIVMTVDNIYVICGTCSAIGAALTGGTVFYIKPMMPGVGVLSYNAVDAYASYIYAFTADKRLLQWNPGSGINDLGFPIADQWSGINPNNGSNQWVSVNPANVSVAYLASGSQDQAVFVCDGNGNIWRCNPTQMPEQTPCWSPRMTVAAGAKAMAAVETSPGVKQLFIGSGTNILYRDWTNYADNSTTYAGYATFGSIVFAQPGQKAAIDCITVESKAFGTIPAVSILPQEIYGTFETLAQSIVDPPDLPASNSLYSRRYDPAQSTLPVVMRHMQLKLSLVAENQPNEILGYSIYASVESE